MADAKRTFPTGGRVSPEDLVDREAILGELFAQTFDHGNSVLLRAPRQTGKTWLMRRALAEIRARYGERFIVGTFSMQGVVMKEDEPAEGFLSRCFG